MALPRIALALIAPLLLVSCFLSPGRFESSLDIRADRSFRFAYAGEVIVADPKMLSDAGDAPEGEAADPAPAGLTDAQAQAIVEALRKEKGYRSVEYVGENTFRVDYAAAGRLDHGFVYPLNLDASAIVPWIAVEVREDATVRMTALAFGGEGRIGGMPTPGPGGGADDLNRFRQGRFTLTTDAELVMHNNEAGLAPGPEKKVVWEITPTTRNAPTAVVAFR